MDLQQDKEEAELAYYRLTEEAAAKSAGYMLETLAAGYDLESVLQEYQAIAGEVADKYFDPENEEVAWMWDSQPQTMWSLMQREIDERLDALLSKGDNAGISSYMEAMSSSIEILEEAAESIRNANGEVSSETQEILSYWQELLDLAAADGETVDKIIDEIAADSRFSEILGERGYELNDYNYIEKADSAYIDGFTKAFEELEESMYREAGESYANMQSILDEAYADGFSVDTTVQVNADVVYELGKGSLYYGNSMRIASNAQGGIYNSPILTTFAEDGPEAAVPLDGSLRARNLWMQAGEILGMLPEGHRDQLLLASVSESAGSTGSNSEKNIQVSFNPTITIQGNAGKEEVQRALALSLEDLKTMLEELQEESRRVSFG